MEQETQVEQTQVEQVASPTEQVTPVVKGRYTVSRKGMGGRKPKYDRAMLEDLLQLQRAGTSLLAECKRRGLPYVSINSAMRREGLK